MVNFLYPVGAGILATITIYKLLTGKTDKSEKIISPEKEKKKRIVIKSNKKEIDAMALKLQLVLDKLETADNTEVETQILRNQVEALKLKLKEQEK